MKRSVIVLAVLGIFSGLTQLSAASITFTETVTGSGSLGGTAFGNRLVTITLRADTANLVKTSPLSEVLLGTATVTVAGVGTGTFTEAIGAFRDATGIEARAGIFSQTNFPILLDTRNAAFSAYDLKTPIEPLSGAGNFNSGLLFPTTAGAFVLNSIGNTSTFAATVSEPDSMILLGAAFLGLAILQSRRRRIRSNLELPTLRKYF